MNLYDLLSLLVRTFTALSTGYIVLVLALSHVKARNLNGLTPVRSAVFTLALGVGTWTVIRLLGNLHGVLGLSKSTQAWLTETKWVLLFAEVLVALGFSVFARLFWSKKKEVEVQNLRNQMLSDKGAEPAKVSEKIKARSQANVHDAKEALHAR